MQAGKRGRLHFTSRRGDWARGGRGVACHPDRLAEFRDGVGKVTDYAQALGCPKLNCLAGILPSGVMPEKARGVLVENLQYAAEKLEAAKIGLLLEPVNSRDIPGGAGVRSHRTHPGRGQSRPPRARNCEINYPFVFRRIDETRLWRLDRARV